MSFPYTIKILALLTLLYRKLHFFGENLVLLILQGTGVCSYYMSRGICKFGTNCKFHHPDPESEHENWNASRHAIQGSSRLNFSSELVQRALNEQSVPFLAPPSSCRMSEIIPPQGAYPYPEWSDNQVNNVCYSKKIYSVTEFAMQIEHS